jgi:hypothetical protein
MPLIRKPQEPPQKEQMRVRLEKNLLTAKLLRVGRSFTRAFPGTSNITCF